VDEAAPAPGAVRQVPRTGGITVDNLVFGYPGHSTPVLRDLSLKLPAGATVALVGENGAGKSTLIKVLAGLYRPTSGRILIETVAGTADSAAVDPAAWREQAAILFQDFTRFEFTLRESVGVGRLADIDSEAAVTTAIGRAHAGALLNRLDGGLDALLGHRFGDGEELSGGQWQSIGLARTAMRPEPLLMCLDEPGSALDPFAEERVFEAYRTAADEVSVRVGGVTIFVTHRLSTVTLADLVVVLHAGQVVESGSHADLIALGGRYATLFAMQSRAYA
jgi:ATP-binding cassette, subfamily B, bacterial